MLFRTLKRVKRLYLNPVILRNKPKVFCIGLNKTGTTSLKKAFTDLNFIVGTQREAEYLLPDIINANYDRLFQYCKTAQFFQDVPFSFFDIYKVLYEHFPDAKFILTVRDSPDQWVNSITKFHAKKFSMNEVPTTEELKNAKYVWPGWMWETMQYNFKVSEKDPYNREHLISKYTEYNHQVRSFFGNSSNFIELNLAKDNSYQEFIDFIGVDSPYENFPWENKTNAIKK